jgi:hypothetical protein
MAIATGERLLASDINDLTFFPKGAILTFSTEAYSATSAAFKTIWKICNGQNGTPNLVDKFLRGGAVSGAEYSNPTIGNTQNIAVPVPEHYHNITDPGHTHTVPRESGAEGEGAWEIGSAAAAACNYLSTNKTGITRTNNTGTVNASISVNTMPSYYTVI